MTIDEVYDLLIYLSEMYPNSRMKSLEKTANNWFDLLKDYKASDVMTSAKSHCRRCKFYPTISEIIDNIIPAAYEALGIPEEKEDPERVKARIDKMVDVERQRLGRNLSDDEYRQVRDDAIKIEQMKRRYTRPVQQVRDPRLTKEQVDALEEFIDLNIERGNL